MKKQRQWRLKANKLPNSEYVYVTNDGRVFSTEKGFLIEMIPSLARNGYLRVQVVMNGERKWHPVHRLVLLAWFGPKNGYQVNHKNGVKTDNRLENLEWMTALENRRHAVNVLKKTIRGEKNQSAKLTEDNVRFIRTGTLSPTELAVMFNVTREAIYAIRSRRTWRHVF